MNMSFRRHEVQEYIEFSLGCQELSQWTSYKQKLEEFIIGNIEHAKLTNSIQGDSISYFHKSVYSFVQALGNIKRKNYNWSIVQLYYACFYAIRADILLSGHCTVRCGGLYLIENKVGKKFEPFRIGNVRGDHQMAIALLKKMKNDGKLDDSMLGITLETVDVYTWMMKQREASNYQAKNFSDPRIHDHFSHVDNYFCDDDLISLFQFYNSKNYDICVDIDHAILAIPYKKIIQIKDKIFSTYGSLLFRDLEPHNQQQYRYVKERLIEMGMNKKDVIKTLTYT